jgi:hypothetical protein
MRDLSLSDARKFCEKISLICNEFSENFLRKQVSIDPEDVGSFLNLYSLPSNKDSLILLSILRWYLPEEIGVLLQLQLEEKFKHSDYSLMRILLTSKFRMLNYLILTDEWTKASFFGKILSQKNFDNTMKNVRKLYRNRRPVKKPVRHRGYRDKGSLKLPHEHHSYVDFTQEQNLIEIIRRLQDEDLRRLKILCQQSDLGLPVIRNIVILIERRYYNEEKYREKTIKSLREN